MPRNGKKKPAFLFLPFVFRYQTARSELKFLSQTQTKSRYICSASEKKRSIQLWECWFWTAVGQKRDMRGRFRDFEAFQPRYKVLRYTPRGRGTRTFLRSLIILNIRKLEREQLWTFLVRFWAKYIQRADICAQRQRNKNMLFVLCYFGHSKVRKQT